VRLLLQEECSVTLTQGFLLQLGFCGADHSWRCVQVVDMRHYTSACYCSKYYLQRMP
jgi:hypothetical protein